MREHADDWVLTASALPCCLPAYLLICLSVWLSFAHAPAGLPVCGEAAGHARLCGAGHHQQDAGGGGYGAWCGVTMQWLA